MKISVLLCVFNGQEYISKAIQSILKQDFKDFEFLIINDGSTDNTEEIISKYLEIDSRIKYIYKEHTGLTRSLIFGIKKASGDWIARLDADDYSKSNRLSKQLEFVENNRNIVLLGSNFSLIKENNFSYQSKIPLRHSSLIKNLKKSKRFFPHSSAFFSRKKAIEVGGYRPSFIKAQDHDLWLRLSEVGEIACHQENLLIVYDHKNRVTESKFGYPQYIYAFAAVVSYYSRQEKIYNLEKKISEEDMHLFLEILSKYILQNKHDQILSFKENIKNLLYRKKDIFVIYEILALFFKYRYIAFLFFKNTFLSTNLAYEFFKKFKKNF